MLAMESAAMTVVLRCQISDTDIQDRPAPWVIRPFHQHTPAR